MGGVAPSHICFCGKVKESGNSPLPLYWRHAETRCRFSGIAAGKLLATP